MSSNTNRSEYILIFILLFGFALSSWLMFDYRGRLNNIIDNNLWEAALRKNGLLGEHTIVFFGDSELDLWTMSTSFGVMPILNRSVSGDWAATAVKRFSRDVVDLGPELVVILIGTNDLGKKRSIKKIVKDIETMAAQAWENNIRIVLCSLLPVRGEHSQNRTVEQLNIINGQLKILSEKYQADYIDFFSVLSDDQGLFDKKYTSDGLHPNEEGYLQMAAVLYPVLIENSSMAGGL